MPFLTESKHPGEYVLYEEEGGLSRDTVTLAANASALVVGTVLGVISATGKYVPHAPAASDGSQNAKAILMYPAPVSAVDTKVVVHSRVATVSDVALTYAAGITAPQKAAALASLAASNLIVRTDSLLPVVNS